MRDYKLQREKDNLYRNKLVQKYINKLMSLIDEIQTDMRFEIRFGTLYDDTVISVTAYQDYTNSTVTIYSFDSETKRDKKLKLIDDAMNGKVKIEDFSDMKFI